MGNGKTVVLRHIIFFHPPSVAIHGVLLVSKKSGLAELHSHTVKIFILGCNYSETEVYWTGTKLEHLGFLGVSQFCSGPE